MFDKIFKKLSYSWKNLFLKTRLYGKVFLKFIIKPLKRVKPFLDLLEFVQHRVTLIIYLSIFDTLDMSYWSKILTQIWFSAINFI